MVRVTLPYHLRTLAGITGEVQLDVPAPITISAILDVLESRYPNLTGTIRDHDTRKRRPMIRFYALNEDLSHQPPDTPLPGRIATGVEPLFVIGAIAGG